MGKCVVKVYPNQVTTSTYSLENSPPINIEPFSMSISPHADYPGLEYPPVFEPETYSLANPQSSLNILRKQGKKLDGDEKYLYVTEHIALENSLNR
ncbi:hypothetical protein NQ317_011690 [Molorchus minor]|uniref:Uncharacterized protein n=1 Tax=Molorchus minor TaxID=1323400 RepID=A0ABQ9JQQ8_9CUCU|nr:hypothetical protein NQ317_011690 [Molorchus minor]